MTTTSRLDFGSGLDVDPAYQWDTKHKLFSLAKECAPTSALLVYCSVQHVGKMLFILFHRCNIFHKIIQRIAIWLVESQAVNLSCDTNYVTYVKGLFISSKCNHFLGAQLCR